MKKALGYIRVSTQEQANHGVSLENQRVKIQSYCQFKEFELVEIVRDAGISAKNLKRPGVQKVLTMVKGSEIDAIIVYKLDRMFRSTVDALETVRSFDKYGVSFHSIVETLDTQSAIGQFFFTLTAALAEMERKIMSERISDALQLKKSKGEFTGGPCPPFGFDVDENGKLIPNDEDQKVIDSILSLRRKRWNYSKIARELNSKGLKTKSGKDWYSQTVKNLIVNQR